MRQLQFLHDGDLLLRRAFAAWVILPTSVILFATIAVGLSTITENPKVVILVAFLLVFPVAVGMHALLGKRGYRLKDRKEQDADIQLPHQREVIVQEINRQLEHEQVSLFNSLKEQWTLEQAILTKKFEENWTQNQLALLAQLQHQWMQERMTLLEELRQEIGGRSSTPLPVATDTITDAESRRHSERTGFNDFANWYKQPTKSGGSFTAHPSSTYTEHTLFGELFALTNKDNNVLPRTPSTFEQAPQEFKDLTGKEESFLRKNTA